MSRTEIIDPANRLPDNIRDVDPSSTQSTVVVQVSSHGGFEDSAYTLSPDERDGVVVWSWAAPNMGLGMTHKDDRANIEKIKSLLNENYPVMTVLNEARQRTVYSIAFEQRQRRVSVAADTPERESTQPRSKQLTQNVLRKYTFPKKT
jgi:hypothetical protein